MTTPSKDGVTVPRGDSQVEGYGNVQMAEEGESEHKEPHQEELQTAEEGKSLDGSTPKTSPSPSVDDEGDSYPETDRMADFNKIVREIAESADPSETHLDKSTKSSKRSWREIIKKTIPSLGGGTSTEDLDADQNTILFTVTAWKFAPKDEEGSQLPDFVTTGQEGGSSSDANGTNEASKTKTLYQRGVALYHKNQISILLCLAVLLAFAYPPLGADYLQPQIITRWIVAPYVLIMAGVGMKVKQLARAKRRVKFYTSVQLFSFVVDSAIIFGITRGLITLNLISESLGDGMTICGCLSMSLSTVSVLTKKANGHQPSALINSTLGNFLGIFLSPLLMILYTSQLPTVADLLLGWGVGIVVPIGVGITLQLYSSSFMDFLREHRGCVAASQLYSVSFIVYSLLCKTFSQGKTDTTAIDVLAMIVAQLVVFLVIGSLSWVAFKYLVPFDPDLRVMAFFGCTQKTLPMGVPMICALFFKDDRAGLLVLPLLIWYPIQVLLSSLIVKRLKRFVREENELLGDFSEDGSGSVVEA